MADRTRGALLYSLTGAVLLGGGLWFFGTAPEDGRDPRIARWQATVEERLPDLAMQTLADTMVVGGDLSTERTSPVDGGWYALSVVCAGTGQVRVRLSSSDGNDTGRAVPCSDDPSPQRLQVALADEFYLSVAAEESDGGAVFRWRLERTRGF